MRALTRLCAGVAVAACCFAESAVHYSRRVWRIEDGLPQSKIQAFAQTPDGYLWIGTSGGLVRFDGARFTVFDRSNTPALRDDSILALLTAHDGSLWIGTEGGGLAHMRRGMFQPYGGSEGLTNGFVRMFAEDSRQRLWVGTDRGFFRLQNGRFRRFDNRGAVLPLAAHAILEDSAGTVWVGTSYGLFRMNGDTMVKPVDGTAVVGQITSILEGSNHELWLASVTGMYLLRDGKLVANPDLAAINSRCLFRDHAGGLWVGTTGAGVTRFAPAGGAPPMSLAAPDPLPDNSVLAIFEDTQRSIWVGTQDGLLRLTEATVRTYNSAEGLAEDSVATVYSGPFGKLWMATASGILYRLDGDKPVRYQLPGAAATFPARNIYVSRDGVQWLGSSTRGFVRVDAHGPGLFTMANGLRSNGVRDFLQMRDGAMWVATGSGLTRVEGNALKTFYLEDGLAYGGVRALAEDSNGDLLVGTDGGMNRVRQSRFIHDSALDQLRNQKVWTILPDAAGVLWIGTRGDGLVRVEGSRVTRYTTREGLPSNSIFKILDDGAGRLWMSSASGIFSAERKDLDGLAHGGSSAIAVIAYDTDDGMLSSQMNGGAQSAGARDGKGDLWFPSVKGAVRIDPKQLRALPAAPVLIESLLVDEKPIPLNANIALDAGGNRIEVDFTSPNLAAPDRVSFQYMLEGFDKTWVPSFKHRAAYYTNLPPRHYRFRVIATDVAQPDRNSEASLSFELLPRFYEANWFYGLTALATALIVFGAFRLFARQTRARYALVLAERTRLAREMHDTVIQGCVGVSTLLEAARSMPPTAEEKSRGLIDRAASQIRLTVNEAREAVWDLRHSTIEHGLTGTLEEFAAQISSSEGIDVRTEIEGTPASVNEAAGRNLLLVAREAVRNAVLHGNPKSIRVKLQFNATEIRLEVIDNGKGFRTEQAPADGHYGIVGMKERVEQSGGRFDLRSAPGAGTTVSAAVPLKRQSHRKNVRA